ncbi:putative neutral zinc metallopeptidase [Methylobrevis pamukkalensis]|uniref:Putative neutral zinc metallopeptidase n=1 Tax=Methylobrevis pamukkalensis TaxID=1439726 RepID=A0A1E3GZT4_9HYPH|nr:putative neutral zinc metallopeptidase [Methylobrevis pamukkalensis]
MRWRGRRQSSNVEDSRRSGGGGFRGGGLGGGGLNPFGRGGGRMPGGRSGGLGIGSLIIIGIVLMVLGINPLTLLTGDLGGMMGDSPTTQRPTAVDESGRQMSAADDEMKDFVSVVLAETEDTWNEIFAAAGEDYPEPTLHLFTGSVSSACGYASAASGPFYCPGDRKVYIDLAFYEELRKRFAAPGDFAQAYVIAHEVGHHVQNLIGVLPEFNRRRQTLSTAQANALSVRVELQADCFAGVWANDAEAKNLLETGDIEEALNAATQIGDDAIQKRTQGYVVPESFNHGTSAQRKRCSTPAIARAAWTPATRSGPIRSERGGYSAPFLHHLDLQALDFRKPLPLFRDQVVDLLVEMSDLKFRLEIDPVVVERAQPVLLLLASLAHHDDGRLNGRKAGQQQIEQDEGIGIEPPGAGQRGIEKNPDREEAGKGPEKSPASAECGKTVGDPLAEAAAGIRLCLDVSRDEFAFDEAARHLPFEIGQFTTLRADQFLHIGNSIPVGLGSPD